MVCLHKPKRSQFMNRIHLARKRFGFAPDQSEHTERVDTPSQAAGSPHARSHAPETAVVAGASAVTPGCGHQVGARQVARVSALATMVAYGRSLNPWMHVPVCTHGSTCATFPGIRVLGGYNTN
jgi:hypothetical protein